MLKKLLFAVVPLALMVTTVRADDGLFEIDAAAISDAKIEIELPDLGDIDVDALAGKTDGENSSDAIEACFRRFGYGYGYRHCGYRPWRCYRPYYNYCTPSFYCYRPVYYHCGYVPLCYNYWGCY